MPPRPPSSSCCSPACCSTRSATASWRGPSALPVDRISVSLRAGVTEITEAPQTPVREYAVAVAGPVVSLLLGGIGAAAALLAAAGSTTELVLQLIAAANLLVAVFNMLPGLPLDGGRVLRSVLWRLLGDAGRATVLSARAGQAVGLLVVPGLLLLVAVTGGTPDLTTVAFGGLAAAFICLGASDALRGAKAQAALPGISAGSLARSALPVPADLPLSEALRRAGDLGLHAILVVDADGRARGVVSEARVLAVPEERRAWVAVATTSRPVVRELVLDAALTGRELLTAMQGAPATEYLVTDTSGAPPRVLVAADVAQRLDA